jgi:hypothetical protein
VKTADVYLRRTVVASLINFAVNSMGNFDLANVHEGDFNTQVEFDLFNPMRGINGDQAKRVQISIRTMNDEEV